MNINSHLHFINKRRETEKSDITTISLFPILRDMKSNGIMYVYDDDNDDDEKEFFFHSCVLILYFEGLCGWMDGG